jgi:hypothetical protein
MVEDYDTNIRRKKIQAELGACCRLRGGLCRGEVGVQSGGSSLLSRLWVRCACSGGL